MSKTRKLRKARMARDKAWQEAATAAAESSAAMHKLMQINKKHELQTSRYNFILNCLKNELPEYHVVNTLTSDSAHPVSGIERNGNEPYLFNVPAKALLSPLRDCDEIKPMHLKVIQYLLYEVNLYVDDYADGKHALVALRHGNDGHNYLLTKEALYSMPFDWLTQFISKQLAHELMVYKEEKKNGLS